MRGYPLFYRIGASSTESIDPTPEYVLLGFLHPGRNVARTMQHAPDVDVIVALNIEDEIRITGQRPIAQARQVQLMGVAYMLVEFMLRGGLLAA